MKIPKCKTCENCEDYGLFEHQYVCEYVVPDYDILDDAFIGDYFLDSLDIETNIYKNSSPDWCPLRKENKKYYEEDNKMQEKIYYLNEHKNKKGRYGVYEFPWGSAVKDEKANKWITLIIGSLAQQLDVVNLSVILHQNGIEFV